MTSKGGPQLRFVCRLDYTPVIDQRAFRWKVPQNKSSRIDVDQLLAGRQRLIQVELLSDYLALDSHPHHASISPLAAVELKVRNYVRTIVSGKLYVPFRLPNFLVTSYCGNLYIGRRPGWNERG